MLSRAIIFLISTSVLLSSCEFDTEVDLDLQDKSLLLIHGFISPEEDVIQVEVTKTLSIYDQDIIFDSSSIGEELSIKDASVTITADDGTEALLLFNDESFVYEIDATTFSILPGKRYNLKVIVDQMEFTASTTISVDNVTEIDAEKIIAQDEFGNEIDYLKVNFRDIPAARNYYVVGANITYEFGEQEVVFDEDRFIQDRNLNSDFLTAISDFSIFEDATEVDISIYNVEPIVYQLIRSLSLNNSNTGDPFYQPIIPPNNIEGEGGYGVFGSYRIKTETVQF
ncbi:MAG: hypothetical protein CL613_04340 [Aquimarina sp.]|nr:hypothetical protein [Aquimarina sp.]